MRMLEIMLPLFVADFLAQALRPAVNGGTERQGTIANRRFVDANAEDQRCHRGGDDTVVCPEWHCQGDGDCAGSEAGHD